MREIIKTHHWQFGDFEEGARKGSSVKSEICHSKIKEKCVRVPFNS